MKYWWAVPGQAVECIEDFDDLHEPCDEPTVDEPEVGKVYEIEYAGYGINGSFLISLKGVDGTGLLTGTDYGWVIDGFRPVWPQKREADIEQFKSLLTPAHKELEPAQ